MTRSSQGAAERAVHAHEPERLASWYTPGLSDAVGDRLLMFDNSTTSSLELLRFKPELGKMPAFEEALRQRVEELAGFTHPSIAKVRAVESLGDDEGLALISNHTIGRRLSEIQHDAHGPQFATELVAQLLPVLAALQEQGQGMAHGLLTPERIIVTPEGRLILSEHVLASAMDALKIPADKLRETFGIVLPPHGGRLDDPRADIVQLGYLALSLLVGKRIRSHEAARDLIATLDRPSIGAGPETPRYLHQWLARALQVDGTSFESANDAERALTGWPNREPQSTEQLPRENAAAPAIATPRPAITAQTAESTQTAASRMTAASGPDAAAEPAAGAIGRDAVIDEFVREEPEPSTTGSLLGVTPTPSSPRPIAWEPLIGGLHDPSPVPASATARRPGTREPETREPETRGQEMRPPDARGPEARGRHTRAPETPPASAPPAPEPPPPAPPAPAVADPPGSAPVFSTKLPADDAPTKPTWARAPDRATPKPVRFEIEPDTAPEPSTAAETDAPVPAARRPTIHYVVAGLGLLCFVESLVIAGLLTRQPGAPTAAPTAGSTSATTARAAVSAADTAPPAATRPAPSPAPRQQAANVPAAPAATATPPPTLTRGWLTIETPFDLEVFEGGTSLGSTTGGALSLLAGPHDLRLVNSTLNYETGIRVEIPAGVGITTRIAAPNGTLSLNAMPWANVSLNGKSLGTTPLMNLSVPVGSHEITWRHPQLGERKQLAIVTARGPVTLVMDFYK